MTAKSCKDAEKSKTAKIFVEEEDWAVLKILGNYFGAVRSEFSGDWNSGSSPLPRTIGFSALMRLLPSLYKKGHAQGSLEQSFSLAK
jgi:hypothetical protein